MMIATWEASSIRIAMASLVFFFQAEDGIRDVAVTGVQTCALPIYVESGPLDLQGARIPHQRLPQDSPAVRGRRQGVGQDVRGRGQERVLGGVHRRSEERRVGKEGRSRWSPYH